MPFLCAIIVAGICFENVQKMEVETGGLWSKYSIHSDSYDAEITSADFGVNPDWRKMSKACKDEVCVLYYKHCETSDHALHCGYTVGQLGDRDVHSVNVVVKNAASLRSAEVLIGVPAKNRLNAAVLSFSLFDAESKERTLPTCSPFARAFECEPSP